MLVLGRTKDESVEIDVPPSDSHRKIRVMVCAVHHGHKVRLGIEADKDIKILRTELEERE